MKNSCYNQANDMVGRLLEMALAELGKQEIRPEVVRVNPTHKRLSLQEDKLYVIRQSLNAAGNVVITVAAKMSPII